MLPVNETDSLSLMMSNLEVVIALAVTAVILAILLFFLGYFLIIWWRNRNREKKSLGYVLLQVAVPRDNEIKIDAAEQMLSAFSSLRKSG